MTSATSCYFFNLNIRFGATAKAEQQGGVGLRAALRSTLGFFGLQLVVCAAGLVAWAVIVWRTKIGVFSCFAAFWYCSMHLIAPFALNPAIAATQW
jgi:hypothetical protein